MIISCHFFIYILQMLLFISSLWIIFFNMLGLLQEKNVKQHTKAMEGGIGQG